MFSRIIGALETFCGKVDLAATPRQSMRGTNVFVQLADFTDENPTYGIYTDDVNVNNVSVFTRNKGVDLSQVTTGILLPDEAIDRGKQLQSKFF